MPLMLSQMPSKGWVIMSVVFMLQLILVVVGGLLSCHRVSAVCMGKGGVAPDGPGVAVTRYWELLGIP